MMFRSLPSLRLAIALLATALGLAPAEATGLAGVRALSKAAGPVASAVSLEQTAAGARLIFEMTAPAPPEATILDDPDRLIVDLPETAFVIDPGAGQPAAIVAPGPVRAFRFGLFAPGRSRVVLDLRGPARLVRAVSEPTPAGGAWRLVIELAASDRATFRAAAAESRRRLAGAAEPSRAPRPRPLVVLDPGHGGADTGAAAKDVVEKAVVFAFAKALAARLEADGEVRCLLTRNEDVFVPLADRVRIAEEANASLFVSIHADTLFESSVQGATVYTLSDRASDAHAARLAENENAADEAGGIVDKAEAAGLNDILADLTRRETRVLGRSFARGLVAAWRGVGDLNKNPLRSAGFRVLKAADFPSVLFELGYLSNAHDLAQLSSPAWREKAVATVAASIEQFLRTQPVEPSAMVAGAGSADASR